MNDALYSLVKVLCISKIFELEMSRPTNTTYEDCIIKMLEMRLICDITSAIQIESSVNLLVIFTFLLDEQQHIIECIDNTLEVYAFTGKFF